ncbi:MAG: hypothetical protein A2Y81_05710 [Nitrospirae bacterium RBG_13_43_8]|nr:MAG: hypothetical protein A2Y81_05710 [Nitrospirae bacterium RBG_13_43_8]
MPRYQIEEDADVYGGKLPAYGLSNEEKSLVGRMTNMQLMEDIFGHRGYSRSPRKIKLILREMD